MVPQTVMRWDLGKLYAGPADPNIQQDLAEVRQQIKAFRVRFAGRLASLSREELRLAIAEMEEPSNTLERLAGYSWMAFYTDTGNEASRTLYQSLWGEYTLLLAEFEFFKHELKYLPQSRFDALLSAEALRPYWYYLQRVRKWTPHTLPEAEESLVVRKNITGEQAWCQLYTEVTSALRIPIELEGQARNMSVSEARGLRTNSDRRVRRDGHVGILEAYGKEAPLLGSIFNTLMQDHLQTLELRRIDDLMGPILLEHDIDRPVIDALLSTTAAHYHLAQRYYRSKARVMNLPDFSAYDLMAPYGTITSQVPFEQAQQMVLDALGHFSPRFAAMASTFFEGRYIDPFPAAGKPMGAIAFGLGPTVHPYIFMNYNGGINDVVSLAHELGHGIHFVLAAEKQTLLNTYTVPPLLETVSIFSEMLMFDRLLEQESDPRIRIQLLASQLESAIFTIMRQVMYTFWELAAYERRKEGVVPVEEYCRLWLDENRRLYGDSVRLTEADGWGWLTNPFFVTQRFINYSYGFGQLLVYSLIRQYREQGDAFVSRYEAMLELGGSVSPADMMARLDVDIRNPAFWSQGFEVLTELLEKLEGAIADLEEPAA